MTLTQDATLYAVCAPDVVLPTDGSETPAPVINGACLFVLRPERDGMYELLWRPNDDPENGNGASLYDGAENSLLHLDADAPQTCALRGGDTYYLYGCSQADTAAASCKRISDRVTTTLTFSAGKKACFDLTLRGKTTYTIPDYTPAALDGRKVLGWEDESS